MEAVVNFKIFLTQEPSNKSKVQIEASDVRRFSSAAPLTYSAFCETLESFVPSLKGAVYSVHWMDEDGDFIRVTSDLEMLHAIQLMVTQSTLVKFYVVPKVETPRHVHPGVECNSCKIQPIRGLRYKCLDCLNYDLCQACETRGVHYPDHNLIRFVKPMGGLFDPYRGPRIFSRPYMRLLKREGKRCGSSESSESDDACDRNPKKDHCHGKRRDEGKGHRHHRHHHNYDNKFLKKILKNELSLEPKYLENICNAGASAMNLMYSGLNSALAQSQPTPTANPTESASAPVPQPGGEKTPAQAPAEASASASAIFPPQGAAGVSAPAPTPTFPPVSAADALRQLLQLNTDPVGDLSARMSQNRIDPASHEWTIINGENGSSAQQQPQEQPNSYPDLQLQKGLEILEAMGFNNSTGDVTRVLKAFGGDLYKTLDSLIPKRK